MKKTFKVSLPTNYKLEVLFSQLPYLANLKDPIFQSSIEDVINNREELQKYLLATGGFNNSIQKSLDLVVTDSHLNDAAVWHKSDLNPQTDFFKKYQNPLDVVFKDIAKCYNKKDQIKKNWRQNKKWSTLPNIEKIIQELTKGKTLVQLDFFSGGKNEKFQIKAMQLGLSEKNIVF